MSAYLNRDNVMSGSENKVVTIPAPALYACSLIFLTKGKDSIGAVIIRFWPFLRPKPILIDKFANLSIFSGSIWFVLDI